MAEYIDKKAVLNELERVYNLSDFPAEFYNGYQFAESIVRNFKKADVAEVRHGKWIHNENYVLWAERYVCSLCGRNAPSDGDYRHELTDYCPNCGAKMDGGADNGE